jgi:hypothetical protein
VRAAHRPRFVDTPRMTDSSSDLRRLVRRDLAVTLIGALLAVWLAGVWAAGRFGFVSTRTAATVVVALATVLCVGCLGWWAAGPRQWLRERYLVLIPVFLGAPWAVLGLHDLGASTIAVMLSSALGFTAAVALGFAWASRRR